MTINKNKITILKTIGKQFIASRHLCKFSQTTAANLLGIEVTTLRAIESAIGVDDIPVDTFHRAATIYDVSTDFLFGFSDDWERDPVVSQERQVGHWIYKEQLKHFSRQAVTLLKQENKIEAMSQTTDELLSSITGISDALTRIQVLNDEFIDMRGGATLLSRVEAAKSLVTTLKSQLIRSKVIQLTNQESENGNN